MATVPEGAPSQSWEEVLAAVEADVARTEALLDAERAANPGAVANPLTWQLPPSGPELPPLEQMPEIPAELRERIRSLRVRICGLQIELASELATLRPATTAGRPPASLRQATSLPAAARFVDTRM